MKILVVAATKNEIMPLLSLMSLNKKEADVLFSVGYKNLTIDFLITGVGMVATTYHLTKALHNKYDLAINIGICGSFNKNLEIGEVVNIYEDCFSELGAEDGDGFLSLQELNLNGITRVKSSSCLYTDTLVELLPKVNGITVNTVHGNEKSIQKVFEKFHPYTESMEGAAFMYVCGSEQLKHIQIRAVSNYVELRNKDAWNIPLAIKNVNAKVVEVLNHL